jgi:hypothetical protein
VSDPLSPDERKHFEEAAWRGAQAGDRDAVLVEIIAALDAPLTRGDKRGGWDDGLRRQLLGFYLGIKACEQGEPRIDFAATLRGFDALGVRSGPLHDRILDLSRKLQRTDLS